MKNLALLIFILALVAIACDKDEPVCPDCNVEVDCNNVEDVSKALKDAIGDKSLAVIYTYLGGEPWTQHFDPEHVITENFIIVDSIHYYNLSYLLSFKVYLFNQTPPIYQVHLYFPSK